MNHAIRLGAVCLIFSVVSIVCGYGQTAVKGIPSAVTSTVSSGKGFVFARTAANRLYLSRDGGGSFVAIDTSDELTEPLIDNRRWGGAGKRTAYIDSVRNQLWVESVKGLQLRKLDLTSGRWSSPLVLSSPLYSSYHCTGVSSSRHSTVVITSAWSDKTGDVYQLLRTLDDGDTWIPVADMDPIPTPTQPQTNPVISAVVVLDDGSIVAVEPRGIRRLLIGSDVWIKGLRYEGLTSVRQCGNVLYTWSQTGAWSSRDSGRTFRQILMDSLHKITVDVWAGDSAVIIDVDTARRATRLILVNDTTVVRNLTSDVPHRHIIPYVGTVANANESRVLVSGNGVNQLIEPHSGRIVNIVMTPETYLARRLSRYDRGLAAYVEQQGLYRIDAFGRARLDTFVTYSSKRITNLIASPNGSVLVTNTNRYHVWFNENIRDTVIVNRRSDYWRDPQFITETEVYSGASQNGIEVRQLRDTNNKYLVQDGLPTFDRTPATALLEGYPLGFVNGSLICLASGVDRSIGNGVSMNGGVFQIADSKWVHLDDSELGEHRRLSASGECYDNVALMFGYDRYPASSLVQPDQFAYYGKRSKVVRLSGGSDGISTYNFTTVIDEDHVAMYSNVHDTVAVVDLRNMTTTHILAGVPSAIATLNHNIAVATWHDGLMLYPIDTLASTAPDEQGELLLRASWYECSQRLLHVNVKQPSTSPFEIEVYDIVGKVRLRLTHSAQAAFDGSLTFEEWLSPGVYILKVSTGSRSNTQMLLVEDC